MVKKLLILSVIIFNLLLAQGRSLPAFIYGPSATSYKMVADTISVKKLKLGKRLSDDLYISSGRDKTFLLVCNETLLELLPESKILIDRSEEYLRVIEGNVILHKEDDITAFCYNVVIENGSIGYIGRKNINVNIDYSDQYLSNGIFYPTTDYLMVDKNFIKENERDGKYVVAGLDASGDNELLESIEKKEAIKRKEEGFDEIKKFVFGL